MALEVTALRVRLLLDISTTTCIEAVFQQAATERARFSVYRNLRVGIFGVWASFWALGSLEYIHWVGILLYFGSQRSSNKGMGWSGWLYVFIWQLWKEEMLQRERLSTAAVAFWTYFI